MLHLPLAGLHLLPLAALMAILAGCPAPAEVDAEPGTAEPGAPGELVTNDPAVRSPDLDAARERWESAGIDGYRMTLRRICFCPAPDYTGPFQVTVRDGDIASVVLDGAPVDADRGETVEDLFDLVEDAYERRAERVTVEFHPDWGYPTNVAIDYSMQLVDEEIGYMVSDLTAL